MAQRKQEKQERREVKPELNIVSVKTMMYVAYGFPYKYAGENLRKIINEKYVVTGLLEDDKHLDFVMPRCVSPFGDKVMPCILGTAVYSAMKEAAGIPGKPLTGPFRVLGIYFDEKDVGILIRKQMAEKGQQPQPTLSVTEVVNPGSVGSLVYIGQLPPELVVNQITVGRMKKRGFGVISILWK